jgi:hypothetical protein
MTEGVKPDALKGAGPVLNGGDEETGLCRPRLVATQLEGFWRAMKDTIGAGRCFADLHLLYRRTRQVLMAHHERSIYEFHW